GAFLLCSTLVDQGILRIRPSLTPEVMPGALRSALKRRRGATMPDPQPDPNLSEEPIPLHQVLVEELHHQHPEQTIDLAKIKARRRYWQQQHSEVADPKERERAIESSLVGEFYQRLRSSD